MKKKGDTYISALLLRMLNPPFPYLLSELPYWQSQREEHTIRTGIVWFPIVWVKEQDNECSMTKIFLLFEALTLIATWFGTVYGFRAYYAAEMCKTKSIVFSAKDSVSRDSLKSSQTIYLSSGAAIAMIGVSKGTEVLDHSPLTTLNLRVLNIIGLLSFSFAPI
ncbi:hypothetical protein Tco_0370310 [Tanacetum coccineum]